MITEQHGSSEAGPPDYCRPFLDALPVSGASVTVVSVSGTQLVVCSSDSVAARLQELQFELGEGPERQALQSGAIVSIADVRVADFGDWPVFGAAVADLAVRSVFAVPMNMGAVTVGVVTLYAEHPLFLSEDERITALAIASAIAGSAVRTAMQSAGEELAVETATMPALRREVHQATGMILVQLDTSATIAYSRLQAYAFAKGRTVQAVAHDVVTGKLSFDPRSTQ